MGNTLPELWQQVVSKSSLFSSLALGVSREDDGGRGRTYEEMGEFGEGSGGRGDGAGVEATPAKGSGRGDAAGVGGSSGGQGGRGASSTSRPSRRSLAAPEIFDSWWEIERALLNVTSKLFARLNITAFSVEGISALDPIALAIVWQRQNSQRDAVRLAREQNIVEESVKPDLRTLRCLFQASRYSCAAYGTSLQHIVTMSDVIENGFFAKSFRNLDSLVEDSIAPIRTAENANPSNNDEVIECLMPQSELLHSNWDTGMFAPSCYVAVDHEHKWVVLAIRGTFHSSDALTDACAEEEEFLDGYAHAGMCAAAWNMIKEQLPRLASALHRHPGYELVTTGHSMGGGVAALFTMLLHSDDADVEKAAIAGLSEGFDPQAGRDFDTEAVLNTVRTSKCYTIASPSLVNLSLSLRCASYVTSVICGKDIVPRLSIDNVKNLVDQLVGAAPLNRTINAFKKVGEMIGGNSSPAAESSNDFELRNHSSSSFMVPPGRVIHLRHLNSESGPGAEGRHPTAFTQIHLSPRMFLDHFPTIYTSVLHRLCKTEGGGGED
ncbi:putative lipase [Chloropicon primus]|uniref:sn-1-specific diacylglycerol lipase n=2 Tax=Chloropicon primus TaxID=1764295 RepID=A0A5B8MIU9_9CHLO|nr:putative lipase [Chloropicon primus]UPQ98519.1 putative lipase [Chloropicon primus]|eukprot:QDZ19310.1 putative lipase [Chloropicon primus]